MELAHGLLLNEDALKLIPGNKQEVFIYEWLRFLQKVLKASQKSDIKEKQEILVEQLTNQIQKGCGPPTRALIGQCLSALYMVGDSFTIYNTVGKCNEIVKGKDDLPSYLSIRLAAIVTIGILYENDGRMLGGLFPETVHLLIKGLRNAESQTRSETMNALRRLLDGLGSSASMCHRDIFKAVKICLLDRSMFVRTSAAQCMNELIKECSFVYTTEFESVVQQCVRALDGSTYEARCTIARLLGRLIAATQKSSAIATKGRKPTIQSAIAAIENGFIHGGLSGGARDLLKSSSVTSIRTIRVGITEAYIEFIREIGSDWLSKNLPSFVEKVLGILCHPKVTPNHIESVCAQHCVSYILRSTVGIYLGESQQQTAVLELCKIINKQLSMLDAFPSDGNNSNAPESSHNPHIVICCLQEVGSLMRSLRASALPLVSESPGMIESVLSCALFPSLSVRLSAAWCLRCIADAFPWQLPNLIDKCVHKAQTLKVSDEAVSGYTTALSALIGAAHDCPEGLPLAKTKMVFSLAEEILRTASESARLSIFRAQGGWLMIGSVMTLGPSTMRHHVSKLLALWKTTFPRSRRELEHELQRGDAFTWQVTLESRSGALCAMRSFVAHCGELLTEDVTRKLMIPLESAMALIGLLPQIISQFGIHLKASAAMVRLRLYDILALLPPSSYEGSFNALLRELVAEFMLTDNPANTTTSLLRSLCHQDDSVLLGSWRKVSDQSLIEEQLNVGGGYGALEHDPTAVYLQRPAENVAPGPLPLGISVIDASIALFGLAFPHVAMKHRLQMLKHFAAGCKRQGTPQRQRAIQVNVFTALLCALKGLGDCKRRLGGQDVRNAASELIMTALAASDTTLRCAAGEAIGRMAQVSNDQAFAAKTAQLCFEKLKTARDVISRTGHSLALGCLHRYVGGIGSSQHPRMSIGILLALSQDSNSPEVQVWALHALSLIVDAFGPMFRSYVEASLQVVLSLLLQVPPYHVQVHHSLARCLGALVTTLGPELQGSTSSISSARSMCLTSCAIMSHHADPEVQAESVSCLQQLHMFAPRHVELQDLVPRLCRYFSSWHLVLRRSAVSCLRQFAQKEAREICVIASKSGVIGERNLEEKLFQMLDRETDQKLLSDIRDTLSHLVQALALENLGSWLLLCKSVLAASSDDSPLSSVDPEQHENEGDEASFTAVDNSNKQNMILPRWPTRVYAIEIVCRIIAMCHQASDPTHFDLSAARSIVRSGQKGEFLVMYLSDLVRMSFMAATDHNTQLRMAGLQALQVIINYFKGVPEPEFHGSLILDQYQANVGAALRPAFSDASQEVTVRACEVCSSWITSGVVSDLSDLKRVSSLLVTSLDTLNVEVATGNERTSTMAKLSILKAWAQIYIGSRQAALMSSYNGSGILSLVEPHLHVLSSCWRKVIKDHAILKLPRELLAHLPEKSSGGSFFTAESMESVRPHYNDAWSNVMHALALWFSGEQTPSEDCDDKNNEETLHLILGVCVEALCSPRVLDSADVILSCLYTLDILLESTYTRKLISRDSTTGIEMLNALHRLLLTRDSYKSQKLVLKVVENILLGMREKLRLDDSASQMEGEGGESGEIVAGKSTVFAVLEVCMCVLVRNMPSINPTFRTTGGRAASMQKEGAGEIVCSAISLLVNLVSICSAKGALVLLPTALFLLVGALRVTMSIENEFGNSSVVIATSALQALRSIMTLSFVLKSSHSDEFEELFRSALATILDFVKEDSNKFNKTLILTTLSLFLVTSPTCICKTPTLFVQVLDYFEECIKSNDPKIQTKLLQMLMPIFGNADRNLSFPAIHRIAPLVVERMRVGVDEDVSADGVAVMMESANVIELLVNLAGSENKDDVAEMLVLLLIECLQDGEAVSSETRKHLHDNSLARLLKIAPLYPACFKAVLQINPTYKSKMERAIRENQARISQQAESRTVSHALTARNQQPTIKLKDFSNFVKK